MEYQGNQQPAPNQTDVWYLATPYTAPDPMLRHERYSHAMAMMVKLLLQGYMVYSPIVHSHMASRRFELPHTFDWWQAYNHAFIDKMRGIIVVKMPGWSASKGVRDEIEYARQTGKDIWYMEFELALGDDNGDISRASAQAAG